MTLAKKKSEVRNADTQKRGLEAFANILDKPWDIGAPNAIAEIETNRLLSEEASNKTSDSTRSTAVNHAECLPFTLRGPC